uniref:OSJNBb0021I10.4 protein n=1 Tax=Oryza sativa subsp. japonica TaxID=39947 RepID=Q7X8U9_ORYSJ|nr:OSJNBb0021I10.4 [Oryza sativa Japonica Group]
MAEERESFESKWAPSDVTEENLKEMVAHGVLPAKEIIGWHPACGEAFPTPDTHEVVVFSHFFYGGVSLPTSKFFRVILEFYGISLHHLNPNSVVHIANFVHACEAFLGIKPHFALFRRIFFLKPQPNKSKPCVVGGAGFQLRGTLSQKYFSMPFKTSNKGWQANWFYVQNPEPALPEYYCLPPTYQDTWNSLPMGDEAAQALTLLDRMLKLKEQDPESLEFKIMKERIYKIFSSGIVVSYSHILPVVPYNAFNPPPLPLSAVLLADNPVRQAGVQKSSRLLNQAAQSRLINQAPGKGKWKPSDIDPSGKNPKSTNKEAGAATASETKPAEEDCPTGSQSATGNVETENEPPTGNQSVDAETGANQELLTGDQPGDEQNKDISETEGQASSPPLNDTNAGPEASTFDKVEGPARPPLKIITGPMIGDEEEILRIRSAEDSRPPILVKWWDDEMQPQGIVINKQKEDEEVSLLIRTLNQATRLVNRIYLRNEAKTATLEKLVPHLGTAEETRAKLHETRELARKTEHDLRDRVAKLQEANYELSGSSKVQAAKITELERRVKALEKDKSDLIKERDLAIKDVEDHKIKSQAQFEVLVNKIEKLEGARDEVANAATPLIQAMFYNNNDGTSEEDALDLINDAQKAADKIAVDVVERFQDTNLGPTGSNESDDEKTESG